VIITAFFAAQWLRARTALFPQEKQQLEFLFYLKFALDLVNLEKKFPALGL
jgi:hypothetical protein